MIKKIFNASNLVEDVKNGVDKVFYTKEERAEAFERLLVKYEPFKLAQRVLAFMVVGVYLFLNVFTFFIWLSFTLIDKKTEIVFQMFDKIDLLLRYHVLAVLAFYFTGGVINGALTRFSKNK